MLLFYYWFDLYTQKVYIKALIYQFCLKSQNEENSNPVSCCLNSSNYAAKSNTLSAQQT